MSTHVVGAKTTVLDEPVRELADVFEGLLVVAKVVLELIASSLMLASGGVCEQVVSCRALLCSCRLSYTGGLWSFSHSCYIRAQIRLRVSALRPRGVTLLRAVRYHRGFRFVIHFYKDGT